MDREDYRTSEVNNTLPQYELQKWASLIPKYLGNSLNGLQLIFKRENKPKSSLALCIRFCNSMLNQNSQACWSQFIDTGLNLDLGSEDTVWLWVDITLPEEAEVCGLQSRNKTGFKSCSRSELWIQGLQRPSSDPPSPTCACCMWGQTYQFSAKVFSMKAFWPDMGSVWRPINEILLQR